MEKRSDSATQSHLDVPAEPPKVIWPACGAACDIFWWARRKPAEPDSAADASSSKP